MKTTALQLPNRDLRLRAVWRRLQGFALLALLGLLVTWPAPAQTWIGLSAAPVTLRAADHPTNTAAGLDYGYYEGVWSDLPDFTALTPVAHGAVGTFDLAPRLRDDNFAFRYAGYVEVLTDGLYTFYTNSDDGSQLFIGNQLVVNNDGLHGAQERRGRIGLRAGLHAITVTFFERTGGQVLGVSYAGPGLRKRAIPASALFRSDPSPRPVIANIQPNTAVANSGAYGLIVTGRNFIDGVSVVNFNGAAIFTQFLSATELNATIPASALTTPGTYDVAVRNTAPGSGGLSAPVPFTVTAAPPTMPTVTSLSPSTAPAGAGDLPLIVNGTNFYGSATVVNFNGTALPTTFVSATVVTATVPASALALPGSYNVTVTNPAPGGTSAPVLFTVSSASPATPTITGLSPGAAVAGQAAVALTVTGTNFSEGVSAINFNGAALPTTFVSATRLTATVPAEAINLAGTYAVAVRNTAPGSGGLSAPVPFTVTDNAPAPPTITGLTPDSVVAGSGDFTLTVTGANFVEGLSIINFDNGRPRSVVSLATTFVSATELRATVPAANVAFDGPVRVSVRNTSPLLGTGPVASATFTVTPAPPAAPAITSLSPNTAVAGSSDLVLTVTGANFINGVSVVSFDGVALATTPVLTGLTLTQLTATVPASALAMAGTYDVAVRNTAPGSGGLSAPVPFTVTSATPAPVLAVNAGGSVAGQFQADRFTGDLEGGARGTAFSTAAAIDVSGVGSPAPEAVYQSQRKGSGTAYFVYRVTSGLVQGQSYRLRLHFAEIDYTSAGQRRFNVLLNGSTPLLTDFDVLAEAGAPNKAVVKDFTFTAGSPTSSGGYLYLSFRPGAAGEPTVSGIEVLPAAATPRAALANAPARGSEEVQLYPNPARNQVAVSVQLRAAEDVRVDVYDTFGRPVAGATRAATAGWNTVELPLTGLAGGVYTVKVWHGATLTAQKLVVEP